jgi:TatD DNase family protein
VPLVDSHCHLNADRFDDDVEGVLASARDAGVARMLVPGWNLRSSEAAIALAHAHPALDIAVGVHPHDAAKVDGPGWRRIVELAGDRAVVAIGETGLDYDRMFSPIDDQLVNLRRNLALALETGKPAILHCRSRAGARDAQDALLAELRAVGFGGEPSRRAFGARPPAVLHSFSGPVDYAAAMLELGLAVSFSGLVFRKGEEASAEVARLVPRELLLVETDAPFLAPPRAPRRRNEPAFVGITASWLADRRDEEAAITGDALVEAYDRVFGSPATEPGHGAS